MRTLWGCRSVCLEVSVVKIFNVKLQRMSYDREMFENFQPPSAENDFVFEKGSIVARVFEQVGVKRSL